MPKLFMQTAQFMRNTCFFPESVGEGTCVTNLLPGKTPGTESLTSVPTRKHLTWVVATVAGGLSAACAAPLGGRTPEV